MEDGEGGLLIFLRSVIGMYGRHGTCARTKPVCFPVLRGCTCAALCDPLTRTLVTSDCVRLVSTVSAGFTSAVLEVLWSCGNACCAVEVHPTWMTLRHGGGGVPMTRS